MSSPLYECLGCFFDLAEVKAICNIRVTDSSTCPSDYWFQVVLGPTVLDVGRYSSRDGSDLSTTLKARNELLKDWKELLAGGVEEQ